MVDSGCTSHMTGSKEIMTELRPNLNNSSVSYGDKSKAYIYMHKVWFLSLDSTYIVIKYVSPYEGDVSLSIWVPKTLVANKRGPIAKWVPKTKQ